MRTVRSVHTRGDATGPGWASWHARASWVISSWTGSEMPRVMARESCLYLSCSGLILCAWAVPHNEASMLMITILESIAHTPL